MWLTQRLAGEKGVKLRSGQVAEENFSIQGESRYEQPEQLLPYGLSSWAAGGNQAVMLGGYCAGVSRLPDPELAAGEVRLYSAGGAEILLKNNGQVQINGHTFDWEEEA